VIGIAQHVDTLSIPQGTQFDIDITLVVHGKVSDVTDGISHDGGCETSWEYQRRTIESHGLIIRSLVVGASGKTNDGYEGWDRQQEQRSQLAHELRVYFKSEGKSTEIFYGKA
jgi:hypothetical protein